MAMTMKLNWLVPMIAPAFSGKAALSTSAVPCPEIRWQSQNGRLPLAWSISEFRSVTADGDLRPRGEIDGEEIDLSFSGDGRDDLLTLQLGAARDRRDNPVRPTRGSLLRFGVEQSVPIGKGNIFLNRLRGSYSQFVPVNFTNFNEGPETLAFNIQAGTVLGDLPPYEAFSLGGTNSVRGFEEGDLGSGRSYVQATAEYRFPIFSSVGGALFVDVGSDLGTGDNVPGNPAGLLDKPGSGVGYGCRCPGTVTTRTTAA
jgi:outer membrane protein insertion porin family